MEPQLNIVSLVRRKAMFIVCIPESSRSSDIVEAVFSARLLCLAAERSGYGIEMTDIATMFDADKDISLETSLRRHRECEMLAGLVFNVIHYSGSGLISEHLRAIARAAHAGQTPVHLDVPKESSLARYITTCRYNLVTRVT